MEKRYKLIVHVPLSHSEIVRNALGEAGAGKIGNYDFCSFSYKGIGRFRGNDKSNPAIGEVGKLEEVEEEVIEFLIQENNLEKVITELKKVHPYEEIAYEIFKLETFNFF